MRGNRGVNTRPELAVRRLLHAAGYRYFVNRPVLAGGVRVRPDVIFPRARVAVFVDGCYWHGCPIHGSQPRANAEFWRAKFAANKARDRRVDRALRSAGWSVIRAWEHTPPVDIVDRVRRRLRTRSPVAADLAHPAASPFL